MRTILYNKKNILLDEGSFFGKGVFETILWEDRPIFLKEHIERLKKSMEALSLEPLEEGKLLSFLDTLEIKYKALKITVTPLNIIISTRDIPYNEESYNRGFDLTLSDVRRNSTSILTSIKSTCYIENILEKEKAVKKGFNDCLFLNEHDYVTETSCSNIFFIKKGIIFTASNDEGLLRGIIRAWILKNYDVCEKKISYNELKTMDEVFITNSLMGIMRVNRIDNIVYKENKKTKDIMKKYKGYVLDWGITNSDR